MALLRLLGPSKCPHPQFRHEVYQCWGEVSPESIPIEMRPFVFPVRLSGTGVLPRLRSWSGDRKIASGASAYGKMLCTFVCRISGKDGHSFMAAALMGIPPCYVVELFFALWDDILRSALTSDKLCQGYFRKV